MNNSSDVLEKPESNLKTHVLTFEEKEELERKKAEEEKQREILLSQFQNISRYMDEDSLVDNNSTFASWVDYIIDDYELSKINNDRLQFYIELIKILKKDPKLLKQILYINNKIKLRKKNERKILKQLSNVLRNIEADGTRTPNIDSKLDLLEQNINKKYTLTTGGKSYMNKYLNIAEQDDDQKPEKANIYDPQALKNLFEEENKNELNEDTVRGYLGYKYNLDNLSNLTENIFKNVDQKKFKKDQNAIQEFIEDYYKSHNTNDPKEIKKNLKIAVDKLENSPDNVVKALKITREDRYIFILITFFIRYITVLLVQWCIDINIVTSFYQGFLFYAFIYIIIFWFLVMFINIANIPYAKYMSNSSLGSVRNLFYYFYTGTNGIGRLLAHTVLILILLFIPILLNLNHSNNDNKKSKTKKNEESKFLSYEEKKYLIKSLSLFTIFMWIMTSIISMKY